MPKRLRNEPIYLAAEILGYRDINDVPRIIDERTGTVLNPNKVDDKVFIYERQVKEWFLKRAISLCRRKNNNFLIVMIAVSYIEGVEQYRQGRSSAGRSKEFFVNGMKRIFNLNSTEDHHLVDLYKHLRCGLFHNGMSGDAIVLNRTLKEAITFSSHGTIDINPRLFLNIIAKDFDIYIDSLHNHDNETLRDNFNRMFFVI